MFRSEADTDGVATRVLPLGGGFSGVQTTTFDSNRETYALYGSVAKDVNDRLTLEAGGRIEYVDTDLSRLQVNNFNPVDPSVRFSGQTDDWYFSPTLGLTYEASNDVTLFARTSIGVKPAGFTAFSDVAATSSYEDETAWETEVGVRYNSPDENWNMELRGYYKKIDDYQLNRSTATGNFIILNAEEVRAIGIEAEANWNPSDRLAISASAGLSEIEFEKFGTLSGNRVPFVPEFTASLGFRYDIGNGFYVSSAYRTIGSVNYEDNGTSTFKQEAYQILDAQIGYEAENWSATIFGHNILDENYYSFISPQISAGAPGTPALYGVRVSVEF